jgi:hypothetical protein
MRFQHLFVFLTIMLLSSCHLALNFEDDPDQQPIPNIDQCGDSVVSGGEQCDTENLEGNQCSNLGYTGGTLGCDDNCKFDTSNCTDSCGNEIVDDGEDCDGSDGILSCAEIGFNAGGVVGCDNSCQFILTDCYGGCGNDLVEQGYDEDCDGVDLQQQTCEGLGHSSGVLKCDESCNFDTSGCGSGDNCGNDEIDSGEVCDGVNFGGQTCLSQGFGLGELSCISNCTAFDISECADLTFCEVVDLPVSQWGPPCAADGYCHLRWDGSYAFCNPGTWLVNYYGECIIGDNSCEIGSFCYNSPDSFKGDPGYCAPIVDVNIGDFYDNDIDGCPVLGSWSIINVEMGLPNWQPMPWPICVVLVSGTDGCPQGLSQYDWDEDGSGTIETNEKLCLPPGNIDAGGNCYGSYPNECKSNLLCSIASNICE